VLQANLPVFLHCYFNRFSARFPIAEIAGFRCKLPVHQIHCRAFPLVKFRLSCTAIFTLHCWFWICSADYCSGLVAGPPAIAGKTLFIWAGGDRVTILKLALLQISVYLMAFA
jgi:hypothetical protein